ncbi:uncharacterized protein STEHIDRAFT_61168 [Stereum hirsutum FP-91666 SS1]|uniref:uncharacterized protein n=1 Tax=Stereum hirsutum (strain FP-91666) TaxID=721885 RepID=UPI000444A33E|nr:uncharacterized protein STEHIDRAFT_61168 [Stereum hirsutum FP-91666 SS1]EIM84454.1 hypothetical protein STEHIDRAFT_61168 [Stereum hirsutum FP-91666 SS1]
MLPPPPPYSSATAYSSHGQPPPPAHFASRNPFRHVATNTNTNANTNSNPTSPPYSPSTSEGYRGKRRVPPLTFTMLPSHLLLEIVYHTFPQSSWLDEGRVERQRKTLYWLSVSLRLVNRALYIACMHVLRSTYLPAYTSLLRHPYSSDPFPHFAPPYSSCAISASAASPSTPTTSHSNPNPNPSPPSPTPSTTSLSSTSSHSHPSRQHSQHRQSQSHTQPQSDRTSNSNGIHIPGPLLPSSHRETSILDLFIALKVREDVWSDDTELHLEREESFRDLFGLMQPRARLEDLVREEGGRRGVIYVSGSSGEGEGGGGGGGGNGKAVEWERVSVAFSSRRVGLVISPAGGGAGRKRTVVEVARTKDERLEVAARRLVRGLRDWLQGA